MRKISQKLLALCLALTLVFSLSATAWAADLTDTKDSPYQSSITHLAELGVIAGVGDGTYRPADALTQSAAASLLFRGFKLAPVYSVVTEPAEGKAPITKAFYSTDTTVATLDAALMPAAPDAMGTWAETVANTVLEARLLPAATYASNKEMTRTEFALAVSTAIYGADKEMDFTAQALKDGLLPADLKLDGTVITRGEAAYLLDTALKDLTIVTVFATSDIHGNMVPYKPSGSQIEVGGSAKTAYIINEMKKIQPNVLVIDAGDSPYNTDIANNSMGKSSVDVMNKTGYDATALGNHDFDYSFENLLSLADKANYEMLSANTFWKDGKYPEQFKPYIVKEAGGVKIAIAGLTDDGSKLTTHYTNTQGIDFHDQWTVGAETVAKANKEADVVILLAHLHGGNNDVPNKIQNIDLEIGGGNDTFGRPLNIAGTTVVNPGGVGACVNQINLNLKSKALLGYTFNQIILSSAVPQDEEITAILKGYQDQLSASMGEVIGQCKADQAWSSPIVRTGEATLGNLAADALLDYSKADIAIQNGGGIRKGLTKGDVTLGNIFAMAPFDNRVVVVEVTGKDVWAALENGVSGYPETNGKFPQVAGLKYTFDGAKPAGSRIVSVTMADGKKLDLTKTYKVACNNFMAGGGDGYTMLNVLNKDAEMNKTAKLVFETNDYYRNVIADYVKKLGTIDPKLEGRITILNPQVSNQKLN